VKALVVDDSAMIREIIIRELNQLGVTDIDEAADGVEAIKKIELQHYDLLTLDIVMPLADGHAVLDHIMKVSPTTTVVICSSHSARDTVLTALKAGVKDFILKPFKPEKLHEVLARSVAAARNRRPSGGT